MTSVGHLSGQGDPRPAKRCRGWNLRPTCERSTMRFPLTPCEGSVIPLLRRATTPCHK